MKSIQTKLVLIFATVISISLIGLSVTSTLLASDALKRSAEAQTAEMANGKADLINAHIASAERLLSFFTGNPEIINYLETKDVGMQENLYQTLQLVQSSNSDLFESIILVDGDQYAVMSSSTMEQYTDLSFRGYMAEVVNGNIGISDVIESVETGNLVIAVAVPIMTDGNYSGAVIGTMLFDNIQAIVDEIVVGEEGYGYLVDKSGITADHPVPENIGTLNLLTTDSQELTDIVNDMIAGNSGMGFYTFAGVYKMVSYTQAGPWTIAVTANYDDYMSASNSIRTTSIIVTILAILIALIITYFFSRSIVGPIRRLQELMGKVGEGDLTVRSQYKSKDEIGSLTSSFNTMMDNQSSIVGKVRKGSIELVAVAQDMASSSEELQAGAEETRAKAEQVAEETENQRTSVLEVSQALVELSSLVQLAKNKAISANMSSEKTITYALDGRDKIGDVVNAMGEIDEKSRQVNSAIDDLSDISQRISDITNAISGIADQTNLLALNATIEASRAGEHGRGFMVVAEEIRKLAEQTNNESDEIYKLTGAMVSRINTAVDSVGKSLTSVEEGATIVNETDAFFVNIVDAVEDAAGKINDITEITENEVATSDQIVHLIDIVSSGAERNADNVNMISENVREQSMAIETISAASEETNAMAETLNDGVEGFIVTEEA